MDSLTNRHQPSLFEVKLNSDMSLDILYSPRTRRGVYAPHDTHFTSYGDLLHQLLHKGVYKNEISDSSKKQAIRYMDVVFDDNRYSPQTLHTLITSLGRKSGLQPLTHNVKPELDYVLRDLQDDCDNKRSALFARAEAEKWSQEEIKALKIDRPTFDSLDAVLDACTKYNLVVPTHKYFPIHSGKDLLFWTLEEAIITDANIKRCAHCNSFFEGRSNTLYCSSKCKSAAAMLRRNGESKKATALAKQLAELIRNRTKSPYNYTYTWSSALDNDRQVHYFHTIINSTENRSLYTSRESIDDGIFTASDFAHIRQVIDTELEPLRLAIIAAYDEMCRDTHTEDTRRQALSYYSVTEDTYCTYMHETLNFLRGFSKDN